MIRTHNLLIALLLFFIYGCGSDSQPEEPVIEPPKVEQVKIFSFSQAYAYANDEVSIIGENLNHDKSKIEILLDNKSVDIISINENKITIKIPEDLDQSPDLKITIPNATIIYDDSFTKISILDNTKNQWLKINHDYTSIEKIQNFNAIGKEEIYFSLQEAISSSSTTGLFKVKKSFNGGAVISVLDESYNYTHNNGAFFLSKNKREYSLRSNQLYRKNKEEDSQLLNDFSQNGSWGLDLFLSDDEESILVATSEGRIYKSTDSGKTFDKIHENEPSNFEFTTFYALSTNQVWLAGYTYPFPEDKSYYPAKILYIKEDGNWYNKTVKIEIKDGNREVIEKIHFTDSSTGFAIAELSNFLTNSKKYVIIKSITKGDTWNILHESDSKIEGFTFKNKDIGWYISGNSIFKTTNGGTSWSLDYTNDTLCKGILYNEGILWVIANEKILKYYL